MGARLYRDGFGRTVQVDEEQPQPAGTQAYWTTAYTYDLLDRLTGVDKKTAAGATGQVRVFGYDPLGRLLSVQLPEYGGAVMSYTYDDLGNVLTKTLGAYSETMAYDGFGRLTDRVVTLEGRQTHYTFAYDAYSGGLPAGFTPGGYTVGRPVYDGVTHPDGTAVERWFAYEWRGLLQQKAERFGGTSGEVFSTEYQSYDRAGDLLAMRYPSGQVATWTYGDGGGLAGVGFDGQALASSIAYAAHGAPTTAVLGDSTTGQTSWAQAFNARLWPGKIMTGPGVTPATPVNDTNVLLGLEYSTYENNGNITGANRYYRTASGTILNTMTNTYAYDNLNRLSSYNFTAGSLSGIYNYSMDEFGNLLEQIKQSGNEQSPMGHANNVDRATNRLTGAGITYDLLGNQTQITGPAGPSNLVYLDQGHVYDLKSSDGATLLYRYYYDAEGKRRIKAKATGGAVSLADNCSFYFYSGEDLICQKDLGAEVVPESANPGEVNGAYYQPKFLLTDHLGTTRAELMFDPATLQPKLAKTYDTMPYGELIATPTGRSEPILFSGKPRDNESGLDYFGARFYLDNLYRWISVDLQIISDKNLVNPQRWDLYNYCTNNPVTNIDPDGKDTLGSYGNTLNQIRADCGEEVYNKIIDQQGKAAVVGMGLVGAAIGGGALIETAPVWGPPALAAATKFFNSEGGQTIIQSLMETIGGGEAPPSSIPIPSRDLKHCLDVHTIQSVERQLSHVGMETVENNFKNKTFFNINWSAEKVEKAINQAVEMVGKSGKVNGNYTFKIFGESVTVSIKNGKFKTAWGSYTWDSVKKIVSQK